MQDIPVVNAWTQWGRLRTVVVGRADPKSCHLPHEPACHAEINDPAIAEAVPWPAGQVKHSKTIQLAAAQLDNLAAVLEAETVCVKSMKGFDTELKREVDKKRTEAIKCPSDLGEDVRVYPKGKVNALRPDEIDWSKPVKAPHWDSPSQYCATCPRDSMITLGNTILEGTMSKRSRYFEHLAMRNIALSLWRKEPETVKFWACPKPSMADSMYNLDFFDLSDEERFKRMRNYEFCVNEKEPVFDSADITRVGKDIFVQKSMVTNDLGIKWLTCHFPELRVHPIHFPYDLYPSHIDCTFVPLRPPSKDGGDGGLVLINPERPPLQSEMELWRKNGWKLLNAPLPAQLDRPAFSQSSYWLAMNLLSISVNSMVIEENEIPLYNVLTDQGFDPITVPMRHMYEFGGAIHCCTWDIQREESCVDYFPEQEWDKKHIYQDGFTDITVVDVTKDNGGFLVNPSAEFEVGTLANVLKRECLPRGVSVPGGIVDANGRKRTASDEPDSTAGGKFLRTGEGGSFKVKGDHSDDWAKTVETTVLTEDSLRIADQPVMESWEKPYMQRLADLAAAKGGDVLEVGFGLALSGSRVQTHKNVTSHTIIEANEAVFKSLEAFAVREAEAGRPKVIPEQGLWVDVVKRLKAQGKLYDAILYDPYPQTSSEQHLHQFLFMQNAWDLLKPGGRFVYCNLTSIGKLKEDYDKWEDLWTKSQVPYLTRKLTRFDPAKVSYSLFEFSAETKQLRGDCEYYMHDHALCPVCIK